MAGECAIVLALITRMPATPSRAHQLTGERQSQAKPLRRRGLDKPPLLAADAPQLDTLGGRPRDAVDTVGRFHKPAPPRLRQRLPRRPDPIESRNSLALDILAFGIAKCQPGNAHDVAPRPIDFNIDADLTAARHGARHPPARV